MAARTPQRQSPLAEQIAEILLERIASGLYPAESRLPSESELAEELAVSRATVRSALSTLAASGIVKRRHGVGTFVRRLTHVLNPLNEVTDYRDLITGQGLAYGIQHLRAVIRPPVEAVREALRLEPGALALHVSKGFTADGEPLAYTLNVIPVWVFAGRLREEEALQPGVTEPLFEFLEQRCGQHLDYYHAALRPELARNIHIEGLATPLDPLLPVLVMEEVGYNDDEQAVIYEEEYLLGRRMKFDLIRRFRRTAAR